MNNSNFAHKDEKLFQCNFSIIAPERRETPAHKSSLDLLNKKCLCILVIDFQFLNNFKESPLLHVNIF